MTEPKRLGATLLEWQWAVSHFNGGQDLLPAVGDPAALAKRHKKIKDTVTSLAKTPSSINSSGECHRLSNWSERVATRDDLERWASMPELNVLLITRNVRVIDIDVTDETIATGLEDYINNAFGVKLPTRYRDDSAKRSMLLRVEPHVPLSKRIVRLGESAHMIEFLADGQQTLLFGTHDSGARMRLRNHEDGIPSVSFERLEALWNELRAHYNPKAKPFYDLKEQANKEAVIRKGAVAHDEVLEYLITNGHVIGFDSVDRVSIHCPWRHEHTSNENDTSTSWLVANENQPGGFKCLHAHCENAGRNTQVFLTEIGYTEHSASEAFESTTMPYPVVVAQENQTANVQHLAEAISSGIMAPLPGLGFMRNAKGEITRVISNLNEILRSDSKMVSVKYDCFTEQMTALIGSDTTYRPVTDDTVTMIREIVERRYGVSYSAADTSSALSLAARTNTYDSGKFWVEQTQWDGVPRVQNFAEDILKTPGSPYATAVSRYLWASLAGRVLSPGVKADMSVVLVSTRQGTGKSSLVESLAPFRDWYSTVDLSTRDDDTSRLIRGRVVLEMAELRGLSNKDSESVKAWMTRTEETWTPKYKEFSVTYPRRCVFVGTTNQNRFLRDPTGHRRWLPIRVAVTSKFIDWPRLRAEIGQYWAEAKALLQEYSDVQKAVEDFAKSANSLAEPARLAATILDERYDDVKDFLRAQPPEGKITVTAVKNAMHLTGTYDTHRTTSMLRMLGWEEVDGTSKWKRTQENSFTI
jgi:predicted P-loop ATPase